MDMPCDVAVSLTDSLEDVTAVVSSETVVSISSSDVVGLTQGVHEGMSTG